MKYGILMLFLGISSSLLLGQNKNATDHPEQNFQVSLIMPFCAEQLMENPNHKNASIGNACRQYYEGFLLALDSFKNNEIPIVVQVYDNKRDSIYLKRLLEKKEILNSDLIIGPVLKEGSEYMIEFCHKNKIYHISPFLTLTKSKIDNPYLISAYPDLTFYGDFLLNYIKEKQEKNVNITLITGKDNNDKLLAARINALKSKYSSYTIKNIEIGKYAEFQTAYKPGMTNYVIVNSENEFQVASTLKYLSDTTLFSDLQVFGLRKWLDFKSPNIPQFEQLNVRLISPFYMNYTDSSNRYFLEKYRERFYTEPSEYAIVGYEQATFFISSMVLNKGRIEKVMDQVKSKPLSNWIKVSQKPEGKSYQNCCLNLIYFSNGKLNREELK